MKQFDLESQYQQYLKRVGLVENKMAPLQKKQLRQTFFGACGALLMLLKNDITPLPEDQAVLALEDMINQVANYFGKQVILG